MNCITEIVFNMHFRVTHFGGNFYKLIGQHLLTLNDEKMTQPYI